MNYRVTDMFNFVTTAPCATMSEAAKKLAITQPSLSQSIKRLETDLNVILFYRTKSVIELTPDGTVVLLKAKAAASALEELETSADHSKGFGGRAIIIGCHPVIGSYMLPLGLQQLKKTMRDFSIDVRHGTSREIQNQVQNGKIDFGIVVNPNKVPDLVIKPIAQDEVFVWSSFNEKLPDKIICNQEIYQTQSILNKWHRRPTETINSESFDLIARLTDAGIGYGIIPERAVELIGLKLKKHKDLPSFKDSICLVYRPEFGKKPYEKELIASITKAVQ